MSCSRRIWSNTSRAGRVRPCATSCRPGYCRYRASRDHHHYRVQSLEFTTAPVRKLIDTFDGFRKKRNVSSYDVAGTVSDKEADDMFKLATSLRTDVEKWIRATHPNLFKPNS